MRRSDISKLTKLNLITVCPRCARHGRIYADASRERFAIVWEGPGRGGHDTDIDTSVRVEDLLNPEAGCGYDPRWGEEE